MTAKGRALVFGGATGLVGRALCDELTKAGWLVQTAGRAEFDFAAPDAADSVASLLDDFEPDCVFNAIGYTQVDKAEDEPEAAALLNRTLPAMLGRLMLSRPCTLVHYSTDFVFDGKKNSPYAVDDRCNPLCIYGQSKLAGEEALLALALPRCLILRTAWLFGPYKKNFVSTILGRCRENQALNVVHDQMGSPTYTPDLAHFSLRLVEAGATGIFHVVNSGQASWCELAEEAVRLAQLECRISPVPSDCYPQKARRPAYSVLDNQKLDRVTGLSPRPWLQALCEYVFRDFAPHDRD